MKQNTQAILQELINQTETQIKAAETLKQYDSAILNWKANADSWSVLQCLAHLNLYSDFYNPEIKRAITNSIHNPEPNYQSGWLGNYFANSMLPKEKLNKMKTFKDKNPIFLKLSDDVLDEFIKHQKELVALLEQAKKVSLNRTKTAISISSLIKLRLGDTFRFLINHNIRHFKQIERVLKAEGLKVNSIKQTA